MPKSELITLHNDEPQPPEIFNIRWRHIMYY